MSTIILATDFSSSARNALSYACELTYSQEVKLVLTHIYTIPVSYTGDGVSLSTLNDAFEYAEDQLRAEKMWVKENFPEIQVNTKAVTSSSFTEGLLNEIAEEKPDVVVMGAAKNYGDLWLWDSDTLRALTELPVPVLIVPPNVLYKPVHNIAFACDFRHIGNHTPIDEIKRYAALTKARLHVVNVVNKEAEGADTEHEKEILYEMLKELNPKFHQVKADHVISAISHFASEEQIDCLMVIPRKHGIWESLWQKSHTKELARLNRIPILALHEH
jgi:nucleotide-binding universal stress UspA family protein